MRESFEEGEEREGMRKVRGRERKAKKYLERKNSDKYRKNEKKLKKRKEKQIWRMSERKKKRGKVKEKGD